jgi:hypothetical protein
MAMKSTTVSVFTTAIILLSTQSVFSQNILNRAGITSSVPLSAAFSLRLLSTGYAGNAIQVRRSSDNATQNVGFTVNGDLDTVLLKTFTGSNSAFVVTWYDQSGNAAHLTQATAARQPSIVTNGVVNRANGLPIIRFSGLPGGTYNSLNLAADMTTVGHVSAVHHFAPGGDGFLLGHTGSYYWHSNPTTHLFSNSYTSSSIANGLGWTNGMSVAPLSMVWPGNLTITEIQPSIANSSTTWNNIGSDRVYHHITNGGYSELIVFTTALSAANRQSLEGNQWTTYFVSGTLPVTWLSFTAELREENVLLSWQTVWEQQSKEFIVQHSSNGITWINVANLPASGNRNSTSNYNHIHTAPVTGSNYYRIRQIDQDGRSGYSEVRQITMNRNNPLSIVTTNLVDDGRLQLRVYQSTYLSLYNAEGKLIWKKQFAPGTHIINTGNYLKGIYFLKCIDTVDKILIR